MSALRASTISILLIGPALVAAGAADAGWREGVTWVGEGSGWVLLEGFGKGAQIRIVADGARGPWQAGIFIYDGENRLRTAFAPLMHEETYGVQLRASATDDYEIQVGSKSYEDDCCYVGAIANSRDHEWRAVLWVAGEIARYGFQSSGQLIDSGPTTVFARADDFESRAAVHARVPRSGWPVGIVSGEGIEGGIDQGYRLDVESTFVGVFDYAPSAGVRNFVRSSSMSIEGPGYEHECPCTFSTFRDESALTSGSYSLQRTGLGDVVVGGADIRVPAHWKE